MAVTISDGSKCMGNAKLRRFDASKRNRKGAKVRRTPRDNASKSFNDGASYPATQSTNCVGTANRNLVGASMGEPGNEVEQTRKLLQQSVETRMRAIQQRI